jgi:hypothetical protein
MVELEVVDAVRLTSRWSGRCPHGVTGCRSCPRSVTRSGVKSSFAGIHHQAGAPIHCSVAEHGVGAQRGTVALSRRLPNAAQTADTNREMAETMRWIIFTILAIGGLLFFLNHVVTNLFN